MYVLGTKVANLLVIFSLFSSTLFADEKIKKQDIQHFEEELINIINSKRVSLGYDSLIPNEDLKSIFKLIYNKGGKRTPYKKSSSVLKEHELKEILKNKQFNSTFFKEKTTTLYISKRRIKANWGESYVANSFITSKSYLKALVENDIRFQSLYEKDVKILFLNLGYNASVKKFRLTILYASPPFSADNKTINLDSKSMKLDCSKLFKNYSYLPWLFTDNTLIQDGKLFFTHYDMGIIDKLQELKVKVGADLLHNKQFECGKNIKLNINEFINGIYYPPVPLSRGKTNSEGVFSVEIGRLPEKYKAEDVDINWLFTIKQSACFTIKTNKIIAKNINMQRPKLIIDSTTDFIPERYRSYTLPYKVYFSKNSFSLSDSSKARLTDISDTLRDYIRKITIRSLSSIEGDKDKNKELQKKRAESVLVALEKNTKDIETAIKLEANWKDFYNSIEGSPYQEFVESKSKKELIEIINQGILPFDIEEYLKDQRYCEVKLQVKTPISQTDSVSYIYERYKEALKAYEESEALYFQLKLFELVKQNKIHRDSVKKIGIRHLKQFVSLNNNKIAFFSDEDSTTKYKNVLQDIDIQLYINETHPYLVYNKLLVMLYLIQDNPSLIKDAKQLKKWYYSVKKSIIPFNIQKQLDFYYNVILADYYYYKEEARKRQSHLNAVKQIIYNNRENYNLLEIEQYVNYFAFQLKFDWAAEFLYYYLSEQKLKNQELVFNFLHYMLYFEKTYNKEIRSKYIKLAITLNPDRFCSLFREKQLSIDVLIKKDLRDAYCKTCYKDD